MTINKVNQSSGNYHINKNQSVKKPVSRSSKDSVNISQDAQKKAEVEKIY